ncbi:telomerase RNA component interacting RNase [Protobothrops mucrosquamatus]|uniref:telomerase RNA component interacting RNase n=1 Tax=Protobothrops mucrosquamatus TaxID=103944 RepID=UPI0010FB0FBA|nr:telomerase RNA component interacting RNase [Protobothrops mucrosquamatus]
MAGVPGGEGPASEAAGSGGVNVFANDGSFLELFKRRMEEAAGSGGKSGSETAVAGAEKQKEIEPRHPFTQVGKRRGGSKLALKTGVVAKKQKTEEEVLTNKGDAWAKYMAEVKKYKAHQCSDDDKTRPLVK